MSNTNDRNMEASIMSNGTASNDTLSRSIASTQSLYVKFRIMQLIVGVLVFIAFVLLYFYAPKRKDAFSAADYVPSSSTDVCPTHYKCGASTIDQAQLENALAARLRASEANSETPNFTTDQVFILPRDSEPTEAMKRRADCAREGVFPWEGMRTPYEDIEKKLSISQTARMRGQQAMAKK